MAKYTVFPLYTDDYLGDTTHLTTIEHGAYLMLLIACWRSGGSLPDNDKLLARYAKLTSGQWARMSDVIRAFFVTENDRIMSPRLTDELEAVRQKSKTQKTNADARWLKRRETRDAVASDRQCQRDASSSSSSSSSSKQDSEPNGSSAVARVEPEDLKSRIFGPALTWMAKHTGKTERALRSMLGKWCRDHGDGATLEALQAASRAGPIEPVAWIEAKLAGTAKQTYGQPFKTSDLLERMAENETRGSGSESGPGGDGDAVPLAVTGPERATGGGLSNGHHREHGAVQPNGSGTPQGVGSVQEDVDEDDMADAGRTLPSTFE